MPEITRHKCFCKYKLNSVFLNYAIRYYASLKSLTMRVSFFGELILSIIIFFLLFSLLCSHVLSVKIGLARQRE